MLLNETSSDLVCADSRGGILAPRASGVRCQVWPQYERLRTEDRNGAHADAGRTRRSLTDSGRIAAESGLLGARRPVCSASQASHDHLALICPTPAPSTKLQSLSRPQPPLPPRLGMERAKGLEPSTFSLGSCKPTSQVVDSAGGYDDRDSTPSVSPSSSPAKAPTDAALDRVIEAWPKLSTAIRAGIVAMIDAGTSA